ncbi:hypothetical protein NGI46_21555 [Peribacillus butanolivorans]|uniref:hypothetical protein n=1 Tax=Peribacillus butanolivorans TaxID=421767 RepID=UPI00207CA8DE|nr:hypothetical protein [Peribacillus butanolivorans]MCO0599986.1 hypothetical protein [Peribacillus butanolivorans]
MPIWSLPKVGFITLEKYKDDDKQQIHAGLWNKISDYSIKGGEQVIQMTCFDFLFLYKKKKLSKHT